MRGDGVRSWIPSGASKPETDTSGQSPVDGGPWKPRARRETRKPSVLLSASQKPSTQVIALHPKVPPKAKAATLAYVQAELAAGREFPDQNDLAGRAGVTKSAVSKWASEWEADGKINRTRVGRRKVIGNA